MKRKLLALGVLGMLALTGCASQPPAVDDRGSAPSVDDSSESDSGTEQWQEGDRYSVGEVTLPDGVTVICIRYGENFQCKHDWSAPE